MTDDKTLVTWLRREAADTNCNAERGEKLYDAADRIEALEGALRRSRRGMEVLMPGIGGLAIAAEEISNINRAFLEADRILGTDR